MYFPISSVTLFVQNLHEFNFLIIKNYRLSHDVVTYDVNRDVLTAYC